MSPEDAGYILKKCTIQCACWINFEHREVVALIDDEKIFECQTACQPHRNYTDRVLDCYLKLDEYGTLENIHVPAWDNPLTQLSYFWLLGFFLSGSSVLSSMALLLYSLYKNDVMERLCPAVCFLLHGRFPNGYRVLASLNDSPVQSEEE